MTTARTPAPNADPAPHLSIRGGHGPGPQRGPAPPARHRPARASRPRAGAGLDEHSCACVSIRGCAPGVGRAAPASGRVARWRLRAEIQPGLLVLGLLHQKVSVSRFLGFAPFHIPAVQKYYLGSSRKNLVLVFKLGSSLELTEKNPRFCLVLQRCRSPFCPAYLRHARLVC